MRPMTEVLIDLLLFSITPGLLLAILVALIVIVRQFKKANQLLGKKR